MNCTKLLAYLFSAFMFCALPLVTACGDDDDPEIENPDDGSGGSGTDDNTPGGGEETPTLTNTEQKVRLEEIGKSFLNEIQAADVQEVRDLADYVNTQIENDAYDFSAVESWAEDCYDNLGKTLLGSEEYTEREEGYRYDYVYDYFVTNYRQIWLASAFEGSFTETNGRWRRVSDDGHQFTFSDQNGQTCVLSLTTSGSETLVFVGETEDEDWENWNFDEYSAEYTADVYVENTRIYVRVPEKINVSLTRGGSVLVEADVTTQLTVSSDGEADLSTDKYSVTADVTIGEYTWTVSRAEYNTTNARVEATMKHSGKTLLTLSAYAEGSATNEELNAVNNMQFSLDILGELQIKGTCSDGKQYVEFLDNADSNDEDETTFTRWVNNANALLDLGVYYDGSSTRQASMNLEVTEETDYWGSTTYRYYDYIPVISFADGTTYAFDEYFTETSFKSLVDTFNNLLEDFE